MHLRSVGQRKVGRFRLSQHAPALNAGGSQRHQALIGRHSDRSLWFAFGALWAPGMENNAYVAAAFS